ncbi:hypothetical protein [Methanoregula sp.]|nr:hypothetical protein [Methanoregula sp.]
MKQRDFAKSLLLRVFRPETREVPARFFEDGLSKLERFIGTSTMRRET